MTDVPDAAELERLGLYDPAAPDAADALSLVRLMFELGGSVEEVTEAWSTLRIGDLALDLAMRPPGETFDLEEFANKSELDPSVVRRLWRALGLPVDGPVRVTPDAAGALRFFVAMMSWLDPETVIVLARVLASSTARLADALIGAFRVERELPQRESVVTMTPAAVVRETTAAAGELLPLFLEAANAVFRRHMVLASYQQWSPDEARATVTHQLTVGFSDLVSSTEAVRGATPAELALMVRKFESEVWDLVTNVGGRVVKLIGDEAMFVIDDPRAACDVALRLIEASSNPIRVGLAHGTVVALYGDYYGETVNLAARLVAAADASTVAVSSSVRDGAGDAFHFEALPERELKGFGEPVTFYRATRH